MLEFLGFEKGAVGATAAVEAAVDKQDPLQVGLTSADVALFGVMGHAAQRGDEIQCPRQGGSGRLFFHPA